MSRILIQLICSLIAFPIAWIFGEPMIDFIVDRSEIGEAIFGSVYLISDGPNHTARVLVGLSIPIAIYAAISRAVTFAKENDGAPYIRAFVFGIMQLGICLFILGMIVPSLATMIGNGVLNFFFKGAESHATLYYVMGVFIFPLFVLVLLGNTDSSGAGPARQEIEKGRDLTSQDEAEREAERLLGEHRDK